MAIDENVLTRESFDKFILNLPGELYLNLLAAYSDEQLFELWQTCQIGNLFYEKGWPSYGPIPTMFSTDTMSPVSGNDSSTAVRMVAFSGK